MTLVSDSAFSLLIAGVQVTGPAGSPGVEADGQEAKGRQGLVWELLQEGQW